MNDKLYGVKGCNVKITHRKNKEYILDYVNEVHAEKFLSSYNGKKSNMILIFCQMEDGFMKNLDYIDEIEIQNHVKYYKDGSDGIKTDTYYDLKFAYSCHMSNHNYPSEFVYVYTDNDVKSGYIKKEINEILNRRKQDNLIDTITNLSMTISNNRYKIQQTLENMNDKRETKDLYFDVELIDNGVRCKICFDGVITYIFGNNTNEIVNYMIPIINKCDYDVKIYGDKLAFGFSLVDILKSRGYAVEPTPIAKLGKILNK